MAPETYYREALAGGRFELQICSDSGRAVFFPRVVSPYTGSLLTEWREMSGMGTVHSTTVMRRKPDRGGDYNVALVDLDEGARMMTEVCGLPAADVRIGMRVKARVEGTGSDEVRVVFEQVATEASA